MVNLGHLVVRWGIASAGIFYRVERTGPELPAGPVLLVANHHNMLLDPLLVLRAAGRRVRVLAKAPLFEIPIFGHILRAVDTLPLYRVQDDRDQTHRNRLAFEETVAELSDGGTLLTFPEGQSHSDPGGRLAPDVPVEPQPRRRRARPFDRPGAAPGHPQPGGRVAPPVGRSRRPDFIARAGSLRWREREPFAARLPRQQRLATQFAWLKAQADPRWPRLARALGSYGRRLKRLGGGDVDVPNAAEMETATAEVSRDAAILSPAVPVVALATAAWLVPCLVSGLASRLMRPPIETIATVKLLAGMLAAPLYYLGVVAAAVRAGGPAVGAAAALALPALGLAVLAWGPRLGELWQDAKLLSAVRRRPKLRDRLAARRRALAAQLDELAAAWARGRSASFAG